MVDPRRAEQHTQPRREPRPAIYQTEVSIQSISKVFTMAQVIQEQGLESIEKRIFTSV